MSRKVDRTSQSMRALLRLRELLLAGEFEAGSRMSELPLVERLGVSRTPLRLALATLEHEGLLELAPGGGYAVRSFTRKDIDHAIELRGVLEGTAARFASVSGSTASLPITPGNLTRRFVPIPSAITSCPRKRPPSTA